MKKVKPKREEPIMTRAKETPPGSGQIPEYKSPPSRINRPLSKFTTGHRKSGTVQNRVTHLLLAALQAAIVNTLIPRALP